VTYPIMKSYLQKAYEREIDVPSSDTIAAWEREHIPDLERIANQLRTAGVPVDTTLVVSKFVSVKVSQPEVWLSRPELKYEVTGYVESFQRGEERHQVMCRSLGKICQNHYDLMRWILSGLHEAGVQLLLGTDSGWGDVASFQVSRSRTSCASWSRTASHLMKPC
jgi:hypothetical protein